MSDYRVIELKNAMLERIADSLADVEGITNSLAGLAKGGK